MFGLSPAEELQLALILLCVIISDILTAIQEKSAREQRKRLAEENMKKELKKLKDCPIMNKIENSIKKYGQYPPPRI